MLYKDGFFLNTCLDSGQEKEEETNSVNIYLQGLIKVVYKPTKGFELGYLP
jgi:hypothetical protein